MTFHPSVFLGYCSKSSINHLLEISKSSYTIQVGVCHPATPTKRDSN